MASRQNVSPVWEYFTIRRQGEKATCKKCNKVLSVTGSSTSGLVKHLRAIHDVELALKRQAGDGDAGPSKSRQASIMKFMLENKKSLAQILARLAAVDSFSKHAISKSYIRVALSRDGYNLPRNPTDIMALITKQANAIRELMTAELDKKIGNGERFSITLDEWTSLRNRHYININLHGRESYFNLGLQRVLGHITSEHTVEVVIECLRSFHVIVERHCVQTTIDGAGMMKKLGRLMPTLAMTCYSHGIHLAVGDILYIIAAKKDAVAPADDVLEEAEAEQEDVEVGLAGEESEEDSDDDDDLAGNADVLVLEEERPQQLNGEYADLVNKVRKDCKKFRRGLADEKLQEYVKKEHGKELKRKLDVRVRWNSIEEMFARYVQLRSCMMKAFVDLKQRSNVPDEKFEIVKQMAIVLKPVKLANEALCRRDATLLSAEGILKFLFTQLDQQDIEFSRNICNRIRERIGQRRDKDVVSLLQYLHDPDTLQTVPTDAFFTFASKNTIMRVAKAELLRLQGQEEGIQDQPYDDSDTNDQPQDTEIKEVSLEKQLQQCIDQTVQAKAAPNLQSETLDLKSEFRMYETIRVRTANLEFLYRALLTALPTSVEAERSFSAAGNFVTKIRSRLSDKSLHNLMFLKKYYKEKK